jgi:hypothetical protein
VQSEKMPHTQPALHLRRAEQFAEAGLKAATGTAGILGRPHSYWRTGSLTAVGMGALGSIAGAAFYAKCSVCNKS